MEYTYNNTSKVHASFDDTWGSSTDSDPDLSLSCEGLDSISTLRLSRSRFILNLFVARLRNKDFHSRSYSVFFFAALHKNVVVGVQKASKAIEW
jgi:hypothetical protein